MELTLIFARKLRKRFCLCVRLPLGIAMALLLLAGDAFAQTKSDTISLKKGDSLKINHVTPVNINASHSGVLLHSNTPAQIISGNALQRLNSFSVADAIRFFTGIQLKDYGGVGGLKTVNVRSLGANHTGVFYDGVQLGNAQNGQVDLGRFSLDNIEEIGLYNGQKSELLLPARGFASASTIYLQTIHPGFKAGERSHLRGSIKGGSFGLFNPSALWQQKIGKTLSASLSAETVISDGQYKFRPTNSVYDTTARRNNTDITAYRIEAGLYGALADSSKWTFKIYKYSSERGLPGAVVANKFNYTQRQWDQNTFVQASYKKTSGNYQLLFNAKYANDRLRYLDPEFVTTTGFLDNRFTQQEGYLSIASTFRATASWKLGLSADYQYNTLDANIYRFAYPTRHTILAAASTQLTLHRFVLQGFLMGTFVNDKVEAFTGAGKKNVFSPTVTASWQVLKDDQALTLRAFYKHIFRLPTFNDLYYTFIGNTLLKPEFTEQFNLGITFGPEFNGQAYFSMVLQADAYYNKIKDKIVAVPSQNLYRWTMYNLGEVAVKGLDVNVKTNWSVGTAFALRAAVNYSYQQSIYLTGNVKYTLNIPYVPLHSGSFIAGADYKKFEFNYSYLYTGERYNQLSTDQNKVYNYMDPWYTHDVSLSWLTDIVRHQARFTLEVNNLLDQDKDIITNFPMPRRFYRFKINYSL